MRYVLRRFRLKILFQVNTMVKTRNYFHFLFVFTLVCLSPPLMAYPTSYVEFNDRGSRIILIGDIHMHDNPERDKKYVDLMEAVFRQSQSVKIALVLEQLSDEDYLEMFGSAKEQRDLVDADFLTLLSLLQNQSSFRNSIEFVNADRRSIELAKITAFLLSLSNQQTKITQTVQRKIHKKIPKWMFWKYRSRYYKKITSEIESELLENDSYLQDLTRPYVHDGGLKVGLMEHFYSHMETIDRELSSKYVRGTPIYNFLGSRIIGIFDEAQKLEQYLGNQYLEVSKQMSSIDLIMTMLRDKKTTEAIFPCYNSLLELALYSGDAYFVDAIWEIMQREERPNTTILVAGADHIRELVPFFEWVIGKPIVKIEGKNMQLLDFKTFKKVFARGIELN